jgi:hypothetical protein
LKQIDLEPHEYGVKGRKEPGWLDYVSYLIAAAIVLPIGWYVREHHFEDIKNALFWWLS